jgi:predicted dehydrogenase
VNETLGIGIIGCGGRIISVARRTCHQDKRLRVIGVHDINPKSVESAQRFFSCEEHYAHNHQPIRDYGSVDALVADPEIDWVMVGSWNVAHRKHVVASFEAGKHVFCEKPLATTVEDCVAMRDAWKASGKQFVIGFTLRFSPHYRKIKELVDEGIVGDIISMEFNETLNFNHGAWIHDDWRSETKYAGTHLLEKCSHDVDLVNWIVDSRASRVASFGGLDFFIPKNAYHMDRIGTDKNGCKAYKAMGSTKYSPNTDAFTRQPKDIVDNQVAIIEYENNVRTTFHTNCNAGIPERRMYILGTEGAIRADVISGVIQSKRIGFDTELVDHTTGVSGGHGGGDEVLAIELKDCMLNGGTSAAGLEEGLTSAITCFGIDKAHATGQVVDMKEFWDRVQ